jgi:hypothetical protein
MKVQSLIWLVQVPLFFQGQLIRKFVWRRENEDVDHMLAMVLRGHLDVVTCIAAQNDWEVNANGPSQWILYSGSLDMMLRIWHVYDQPQTAAAGEPTSSGIK